MAIVSDRPLHPLAFRTRAPRSRTLLATGRPGRWSYRLREEIETWFDLETLRPPKRVPLGPLAAALTDADTASWEPALAALSTDYTPITDQRAGAQYRSNVARALLRKALVESGGTSTTETRVIGIREIANAGA